MKPLKLTILLAGMLWMAACSSDSGGESSSDGGGGQALGGSGGTGGATSGGAPVTGGVAPGGSGGFATGGAPLTGGVGSGGTPLTGGTSSGGGPLTGGAGSGGTPPTGGAGSGGTPPTGGAGSGGTPPTGGAGSGGGPLTGGAGSGGVPSGGTGGTGGLTGGTAGTGGVAMGGDSSGGAGGQAGAVATGGAGDGGVGGTGGSEEPQRWVGTWTASPYYDSGNQPPASLANGVIRQIAHVSLGGSQLRVQFSNLFGNGPVTINSAHIALCPSTPAVDSTIQTATDTALAFSGAASVTIAQGQEIWSDAVDFDLPPLGNLTITTAFGAVPSNVTGHSGSRTTSYIQTGSSDVSAPSMSAAQTTDHWYIISGIDVMAGASARAVVAIGDSITDGRGTDTNHNNRWTDILAARLQANPATADVAVLNQGIGATNLIGNSGTAGQARFDRDVIGQSGVRYAIVYHGVNDIGAAGASTASMRAAYDDLIARAHGAGLLIYGGTILPFSGNSYYSAAHETVRQEVNAYIRSGVFDGVIDFDAALTDGGNPPALQTAYATWAQTDYLHPGPAGYQKMGETPELSLFT
ncbi:MAG TPA: SGNH/GDSL hydrolase family protein, partial [Polyangiaceae bacterium]|nr:SGNH/GDSL hydrolase family protein [Polyangiaceae bacterium]